MKAIRIENGELNVADVATPTPPDGEVLIRPTLLGVCSTDLELLKGYGGFSGTLGHEFVGVVEDGPDDWRGKRVVGEINCVCKRCDMCTSGLSNHCRRRTVLGIVKRDGCFAERFTLPAINLHAVADSISDEAAVFTEPLAAAYQITQQVKLEARDQVAVLGTGRLGLLIAFVLSKTGCGLTAVGRNDKTLSLLDRRGIRTARVNELDAKASFDVVIDATGSAAGLEKAIELVRPRGTLVMKTTCADRHQVNLMNLVVNEITVVGSRCGPFAEALRALARQDFDVTELISARMPLTEAPAAFERAAASDTIKVLLTPPGAA